MHKWHNDGFNRMNLFQFQEELANGSNNDTGIDVNDVSTADTTATDTSTLEAAEETETPSKE